MSFLDSLKATVVTRVFILTIGICAVATIGHAPDVGPQPDDEFASLPGRWDAGWYLGIASGGYRWEGPAQRPSRLAFFPAFPMAVRVVARAAHLPDREPPWLWTGVILSTIFFCWSLVYAHRMAHARFGPDAAASAVWLLALYPFAIFHGQMYSESLFLLAAIGATYHLERKQPLLASAFGLVAGLTRPIGALVVLLLAGSARDIWTAPGKRPWHRQATVAFAAISPVVGTLIYSAYVYHLTGGWFTWLSDQAAWGRTLQNPLALFAGVAGRLRTVGLQHYVLERPYELFNVGACLFMLALVVPVARRVGLGAAVFMVAAIAMPLRVGGFASMGRYTSVLFPAFLWLGSKPRGPVLIAVFAGLQALMAALYYTDRPVF
jgi:hypothetical protein